MVRRVILLSLLLTLVLVAGAGAATAAPTPAGGFRALSGAEAAAFSLPGDVVPVRSFTLANGLTYERYQQMVGPARVFGGQLTLFRNGGNDVVAVIGAYYPGLQPSNSVNLTAAAARQISVGDIGAAGERLVQLQIDPASGRYFYAVETRRPASRWIHWINAGNGQVLDKFNALATACDGVPAPCGFGVQYTEDAGDIKDLSELTTPSGSGYQLLSADGRQETHDQGSSRRPFLGPIATDGDNSWVDLGNSSPAQQALVDAQYYANVTDDYYLDIYGYDWVAKATAAGANDRMEIHAHYSANYNNAFWTGTYLALGDGDQVSFAELTALDVVAHELTHGVTDFTSNLIYQDESGALNESFSDIMASSAEFYAEAIGKEPAASIGPDWYIGEDFDLTGDTVPGFRNMADPTEDGDPSHYADRYTGTSDNGGVHTNSGISNHWYYLLVNGGQNANPSRASGTNVTGIGLDAAEPIAFSGFTALPENATFCEARASTVAVAGSHATAVADAWDEVGVDDALCGGGGNTAPKAGFTFTTSALTVDFTDQSTDTDGTIATWDWIFGDGNTSTAQNPSHTYAAAGTYSVTLTVTDNDGGTDAITQDVTVSNPGGTGVTVTSIDPNSMAAGGAPLNVTISGSGFAPGATVTFENGQGPAPTASNIGVPDGNTITATITAPNGGPRGNRVWDVRVTNPDGSTGVLPGGFTVSR